MKYFKAFPRTKAPFMYFCEWAKSFEELEALGADNDPLIIAQEDLPTRTYGVYPFKIVDGEFVNHTPSEMAAFQADYEKQASINDELEKTSAIEGLTFNYDGHTFPTHASARAYYQILDKYRVGGNRNVMDVDGTTYALAVADFDDFLEEYYKVMLAELEP